MTMGDHIILLAGALFLFRFIGSFKTRSNIIGGIGVCVLLPLVFLILAQIIELLEHINRSQ